MLISLCPVVVGAAEENPNPVVGAIFAPELPNPENSEPPAVVVAVVLVPKPGPKPNPDDPTWLPKLKPGVAVVAGAPKLKDGAVVVVVDVPNPNEGAVVVVDEPNGKPTDGDVVPKAGADEG